MAAVQFLNVLQSKEQVVYHNKETEIIAEKSRGRSRLHCPSRPAEPQTRGWELALGFFSLQCGLSGEVVL